MTFVSPFRAPISPPFPSQAATVTALFYDTFTGADGTLLTAHTPNVDALGGGWVRYGDGSINIVGNRANILTPVGIYAFNVGIANVTYRGICSATGSGAFRFIARLSNVSNYWQIGASPTGQFPSIVEVNAGVATLRAQGSGNAMTPPFSFQLIASGNTLSASFFNGIITNSVSYSSATFNNTATRFGIRGDEAGVNGPKYDDLEIPVA